MLRARVTKAAPRKTSLRSKLLKILLQEGLWTWDLLEKGFRAWLITGDLLKNGFRFNSEVQASKHAYRPPNKYLSPRPGPHEDKVRQSVERMLVLQYSRFGVYNSRTAECSEFGMRVWHKMVQAPGASGNSSSFIELLDVLGLPT